MLRIHTLQQWYAVPDPVVESAVRLGGDAAARGVDLGQEGAPGEITVRRSRHLLEKHGLVGQRFDPVACRLRRYGMKLSHGTVIPRRCGPKRADPYSSNPPQGHRA